MQRASVLRMVITLKTTISSSTSSDVHLKIDSECVPLHGNILSLKYDGPKMSEK